MKINSSPSSPIRGEGTIVSKPDAVVEIRVVEMSPRIKDAITRGLRLGKDAAQTPSKD